MTLIFEIKNLKFKRLVIKKMNEHNLAIPFDINSLNENTIQRFIKKTKDIMKKGIIRFLDILGALCGIIIMIPLTIIVCIENIKNKDYGPIFYTQDRMGKDGKLFKMYKYRSMVVNADEKLEEMLKEDEKIAQEFEKYKKIKNDPRVTKFGYFLRKTSLDEFPQFINVLKGEMSIVGPRPYLPREKEDIGTYYKYIIQHKPGITGLWQVSGRSDVGFMDRLDLDLKYHYTKSLRNDVKILLITVLVTLKRKGAI